MNGAMRWHDLDAKKVGMVSFKKITEADIVECIGLGIHNVESHAFIEHITPRPTPVFDKELGKIRHTILKATAELYGHYRMLIGMLTALQIPYEIVTPQSWQKTFKMTKVKGEKSNVWKNRLKAKAQQLFPKAKITLANADAILICEHGRRTLKARG